MKIYSMETSCESDFRMYLPPFVDPTFSAAAYADKYPEIGKIAEMSDEPHLYISEALKEFFEENFSDSGYFVGDVVEVYPKPVEGKVIRGYYKWILKHKMLFQKEEDMALKPLQADICYVCYYYEIFSRYLPTRTEMRAECYFSERAVHKILEKEVYSISFRYKCEMADKGEWYE